jgi:hypothetical protein
MRQVDGSGRAGTSGRHMDDPRAGFRRQLRIRNIVLVIVGIEATAFAVLRTWGVL